MKKTILTLSFLTLVLSTFAIGPFTIGLKAGINSNKVTATENTGVSNFTSPAKSGYDVGVFARFGKKIYLQPEILYCVINGQSTNGSGASSSQTFKLNTIQIPVLLGFKIIDLKLASLRVFTGPAMSYVTTKSISGALDFNAKDFKNNYWDWQVGAGVDIGMLTLDVRYGLGITKLSDATTTNSYTNKGNVLTMSIGFKFI